MKHAIPMLCAAILGIIIDRIIMHYFGLTGVWWLLGIIAAFCFGLILWKKLRN